MSLFPTLDAKLHGTPDRTLTLILLLSAVVIVVIAIRAGPTLKAVTAAYVLLP